MAALYNLIVCTGVAVLVTLSQNKLKHFAAKIRKNPHHSSIMYSMVGYSIIVVLVDVLSAVFKFTIGSLGILFWATILASAFIAMITTFYVKYDAEAQTAGLTVWSIHKAKEWFKGRKLNEREGEVIKINWKLVDDEDKDVLNFSKKDMHKMAAEPGDLVYISDARKWLGGLKSCHSVYGEPHNEEGVVHLRKVHLDKGLFVEGKIMLAEKEM
jgi:SSS family solute:Na+ symporter